MNAARESLCAAVVIVLAAFVRWALSWEDDGPWT